jgi:tRNA(Ile)-lysidine synthase
VLTTREEAPTAGEQSKGAAAPTPGEQSKGAGDLPVQAVASLPRALRTRVLRLWAAAAGAATPLTAERTAALDALVTNWHGQGPVQLPGGVVVRRTSGRLEAYPDSHSPQE